MSNKDNFAAINNKKKVQFISFVRLLQQAYMSSNEIIQQTTGTRILTAYVFDCLITGVEGKAVQLSSEERFKDAITALENIEALLYFLSQQKKIFKKAISIQGWDLDSDGVIQAFRFFTELEESLRIHSAIAA